MKTLIGIVFAFLLSVGSADAITFTFSQGGFSEGAEITGTFEASDLNNDGVIEFFFEDAREITAFSLSFSGNSLVPEFSVGIDQLFGLVFALDGTGILGDDGSGEGEGLATFPIEVGGNPFSFAAGPGPLNLCDGSNVCGAVQDNLFSEEPTILDSSTELLLVSPTAIPVPAPFLLLVSGLIGLGVIRGSALRR